MNQATTILTCSDGRKAIESIRPENKVEGFADRAFADVVRADHQRVAVEEQLRGLNAPEIFNSESDDFQSILR
jgi:hypothetical protein